MDFKENYLLTPTALVHLFANSVPTDFARELKHVKGIYVQGKDMVYAGKPPATSSDPVHCAEYTG